MISFTCEMKWPVYWTSFTSCFLLLAALCCCNGVHHKTVKMVDPLQSAPESSTMPGTTKQPGTPMVDLGALLDAGEGSVVTLVAGDTRLVAHRAVLAAGSPVFAAMICPDTLEANSNQVVIPDVEGPVLRQLVAFLYTRRATQLPSMAPQLLAAAKRYGVSDLKDPCGQQVPEGLSVENAAAAAVLAVKDSCHSLRQATVTFIQDHLEVMATQGWAEAVHNHPREVVLFTRLMAETSTTTTGSTPTIAVASAAARATTTAVPAAADSASTATAAATATPNAADSTSTATAATTATPNAADSTPTATAAATATATPKAAESASTTTAAATATPNAADSAYTAPAAATATATPTATTRTATTAPLPTAGCHTLPPDATAVSHLQSLSAEQKESRLIEAAEEGAEQEVRALLAAGAAVGARDDDDRTALHRAAKSGHVCVAQRLLQAGAQVNARDRAWQATPLHWAAWNGYTAVLRLLLASSADVGARGSEWQATPLHWAAWNGRTAVVQLLLASSADVGARDKYGQTSLHYAAYYGYAEVAAVLLEAGADRVATDNEARTPLDIARQRNHHHMIQTLQ